MAKASDIFLNDDGTLGIVGTEVHFRTPDGLADNYVVVDGALNFQRPVLVSRPKSTGAFDVVEGLGGIGSATGGGTFSLGRATVATGGTTFTGGTPGSTAVGRLTYLRKDRAKYPLYEALDALIEAVLDLSRRS